MLGKLSAKYESNGNPGTISTGHNDSGGKSYGAYQLAINMGSVHSFINWLKETGHNYGQSLGALEIGSQPFDNLWKHIAAVDYENFHALQHGYAMQNYYNRAVELLKRNNYDVEKNHYKVMRDVVLSAAIQHGVGNVVELFNTAATRANPDWINMSYVDAMQFDEAMIRSIYLNVRKTNEWTCGAPNLRPGLFARFENECQDALNMLRTEQKESFRG